MWAPGCNASIAFLHANERRPACQPARPPYNRRMPSPAGESRTEPSLIGQVIDGRYRITEQIGRGGMGVVYRGEHVSIKRPVAVKVLPAILAAVPEMRGRFEREAMAIGKIDHPNCVAVYDTGRIADGSLYLVMEFIEGELLGDKLHREGALSVNATIAILRHILRGLDHIHSAGVVHRDIKPENIILVEEAGDPHFAKILDFGIAKFADEDGAAHKTKTGAVFGTPVYMSPEQCRGSRQVDLRSDVYSLGLVLFAMVTGSPPFREGGSGDIIIAQVCETPPLPSSINPQITTALDAVIWRCLDKDPERRYQTMAELDAALAAVEQSLMPVRDALRPLPASAPTLLAPLGPTAAESATVVLRGAAADQPEPVLAPPRRQHTTTFSQVRGEVAPVLAPPRARWPVVAVSAVAT